MPFHDEPTCVIMSGWRREEDYFRPIRVPDGSRRRVVTIAPPRARWLEFRVTSRAGVRSQRVRVRSRKLQTKTLWFFKCPVTRLWVRRLYVIDLRLGSAAAHRIRYRRTVPRKERGSDPISARRLRNEELLELIYGRPGCSRLSGEALVKAIGELAGLADARVGLEEDYAEEVLEEAAENGPAFYKVCQTLEPFDPLSTDAGLCLAASLSADLLPDLKAFAQEIADGLQPNCDWASAAPFREPAVWERQPRLETRTLSKAGLFERDGIAALTLAWKDHLGNLMIVAVSSDHREGVQPTLWTRNHEELGAVTQSMELVSRKSGNGSTWAVICPVTGVPTQVVGFREGRFASTKGQNLIFRSRWKGPMPEVFEA